MKYILIITLFGYRGAAVDHIEMPNQEACKTAEAAYIKSMMVKNRLGQLVPPDDPNFRTACIPKGQ